MNPVFSRVSIRARLTLAFAGLLGLLLLVAASSLQRFESLTHSVRSLVDQQAHNLTLSASANQHAQAAANQLLRLLQTPERDKRVPLYAAMDSELVAVDQALAELGSTLTRPGAIRSPDINAVLDRRQDYDTACQATVEIIEIDGLERARLHFAGRTEVELKNLLASTQVLADNQQNIMQSEVRRLTGEVDTARRSLILFALLATAVGAVLATLIARSIVRPVGEAVALAEAVAAGDYARNVPRGGRDEVGAMLRALGAMRDSIAQREEHIRTLAYVDPLTNLHNRTRFIELFAALPTGQGGALILLDIDRFAAINKALGHAVGDRLLCKVAERLRNTFPAALAIARLWADEFALLLPCGGRQEVEIQANALLAALRTPIQIDGQRLDVDASLGIVCFPDDGTDLTTLLRLADSAVHAAKRRHDGYAFGAEQVESGTHEQLSLIGEMREALARHDFVVHYQPKMDLLSRRITGAEALIRWQHPDKGLVPPARFIPFAEHTGFIREITPWLLDQVIAQAASWQRAGLPLVVAANLSVHDLLDSRLLDCVQKLLTRHALSASWLCLEITEGALMEDPETALRHLKALAALGVKLAIDDYGTGQASLAYVKQLPVHELKIDRAFVSAIDSSRANAAIVRSTILLCRDLGLSVVAEGAETAAEIDWLTQNRCDIVQGYGIARPMPVATFTPWVGEFNRNAQTVPS